MIILGSDHNGWVLKAKLASYLGERGIPWIDFGPYSPGGTTDYNEIAAQIAKALAVRIGNHHVTDAAILVCGTGIGMSIAANKVPGIRAALVHNQLSAQNSRIHNNANVLCLGAWVTADAVNIALTEEWLSAKFGEGRHVRRVEQIDPKPEGKIVFANGVFDILHKGHIEMLQWARALGDRLVVGINSDASARAIKGPSRPVNSEADRKAVLQSLKFVDEVLIFDETSPRALIGVLQPSVVVRGGEFTAEAIRERDGIPDCVAVKVFPRCIGYSTTQVIEKVRHAGVS